MQEKDVEVHGDVVHADQGCHGIVLWPWDVNFSMPPKKKFIVGHSYTGHTW